VITALTALQQHEAFTVTDHGTILIISSALKFAQTV
jgi:hypothetical protein